MVLIVSLGSSPAWALNQAQGPAGSNFSNAHVTATGNNVDIGVIEVGTAANHGLVAGSHNVNNLSDDRWYNQAAPPLGAAPANSAGAGSTHATLVADIIGRAAGGGISGVAPDANLFVGNINASFNTHGTGQETSALRAATDWLERNNGVHLFNHSWENGQTRDAAYLDWQTQQRDTLHVLAAGNMNPNGLGDVALVYNGLTVGNLNGNRRAASSDFDAGTRSKPDLMAPGTNISNGTLNNTGTSFAAPQATGVASMLVEEGLSLGDGISGDRMAVRAIMMNSARKRGIGGTNAANASILDNAGTVSGTGDDGDYLLGGKLRPGGNTNNTAPATASWTPEQWSITGGRNLVTLSPLDDELGTGALDAVRALEQHAAGEQNEKLLNAGALSGSVGTRPSCPRRSPTRTSSTRPCRRASS